MSLRAKKFHKPWPDLSPFLAAGVRQTVFGRAIKAAELRWGDCHLQKILSSDCYGVSLKSGSDKLGFDPQGHPLWLGDTFPMACARVDALRSHGYPREALRLAVAVVNAMRLQRRHQLESYKQQKKGEECPAKLPERKAGFQGACPGLSSSGEGGGLLEPCTSCQTQSAPRKEDSRIGKEP